jgi:hypothetical protein
VTVNFELSSDQVTWYPAVVPGGTVEVSGLPPDFDVAALQTRTYADSANGG